MTLKITEKQSGEIPLSDLNVGDWFIDDGKLGRVGHISGAQRISVVLIMDDNMDCRSMFSFRPVIPVDVSIKWKRKEVPHD